MVVEMPKNVFVVVFYRLVRVDPRMVEYAVQKNYVEGLL